MGYIKNLGFYFLTVLDSVLNLLAAIVGCYPCVDTATSYLLNIEILKINKVKRTSEERREKQRLEADSKFAEAKDLLDG